MTHHTGGSTHGPDVRTPAASLTLPHDGVTTGGARW